MKALLNGEIKILDEGSSVSDLIEGLRLDPRKIAVEVNLNIIPKSDYSSQFLKDGDKIEIVQFIAGG